MSTTKQPTSTLLAAKAFDLLTAAATPLWLCTMRQTDLQGFGDEIDTLGGQALFFPGDKKENHFTVVVNVEPRRNWRPAITTPEQIKRLILSRPWLKRMTATEKWAKSFMTDNQKSALKSRRFIGS